MEEIIKKRFGWLGPRGEQIACPANNHLESLLEWKGLSQYIANLDEKKDTVESARQACARDQEAGEHPEWHQYEGAKDAFLDQLVNDLYQAGFIRIGILIDKKVLAAEGLTGHLTARMPKLKQLTNTASDILEYELTLEPHFRRSRKEEKEIEELRNDMTGKTIREVQQFIKGKAKKELKALIYQAVVPEFLSETGRLTAEGKEIIEREELMSFREDR